MPKKNYYKILEIDKTATQEEIKKNYRRLALEHHPDKNAGSKKSEEKFKEIAEAYAVLSDEEKRRQYDSGGLNRSSFNGWQSQSWSGNNPDINDFMGRGSNINMDDIFENLFRGRQHYNQSTKQRVQKGSDLRIKMHLTLEELFAGVNKKVKLNKSVVCKICSGTGAKDKDSIKICDECHGLGQIKKIKNTVIGIIQTIETCSSCGGKGKKIKDICDACKGSGSTYEEEIIEIGIPKGIRNGDILKVIGVGNFCEGGINGDLQVLIEEIPHDIFKKEGDDVNIQYRLSIYDALMGCQIQVPMLDGKYVAINIEQGAMDGKILRLGGVGLFKGTNTNNRGDMYITLKIWIPKILNEEEKKVVEQLKDLENFKPKNFETFSK